MKKIYTLLLSIVLVMSMVGCKNEDTIPTNSTLPPITGSNTTTSSDFQKNLHQTQREVGLPTFLETDTGYYIGWGSLYFLEKDTMKATIVCAKPDCDHTDSTVCNAMIDANYLLTLGERIYYVGNGNDPKRVGAVNLDGTRNETIQTLKFNETSNSQSSRDKAIYHRGYVYYVSDDILYRVTLGGEKDSAEEIWSPENAGSTQSYGNQVQFNPNAIRYTLWADGDMLYFMANVQTTDGTYKDVLFQCDLNDMDVKQVWATPGKNEVGEWEQTGVSVSQWYVMDGYIYFYLSGGDMWRTELATGKLEKLADTHEKTQYGSAIFSDDNMCLLNDEPTDFDGKFELGGLFRGNADAIFLYGLDGSFIKKISLNELIDELGENLDIDLLMCDSTDVYFLATTTVYSTQYGMPVGNTGSITLWRANFETGEVTQVYKLR